MKCLPIWNGNSVSFFTKLEEPPIPLPGLLSHIRLFNIVFNGDGSLYTSYFGSGTEVEEKYVINGQVAHQKTDVIHNRRECRISIHGSGEVRSFIRGKDEVKRHLGYELRNIKSPMLIAEHRIGTAGEYIPDTFGVQIPKSTAFVIPGIFEQPLRAVFGINVAPSEYFSPQSREFLWSGLTKPMDNCRKLVVGVDVRFEDKVDGQPLMHEIRVFTK
ncbi:MAG: hypothetical protein HQK72_14250 [Desulfamplus sp.]|nr:hypothetical protein [Desulfamplus sp.]